MHGLTATYIEIDGVPQVVTDDGDDTLSHLYCDCKGEDIALCGSDLSDAVFTDFYLESSKACVVCKDLDETHDDVCPLN